MGASASAKVRGEPYVSVNIPDVRLRHTRLPRTDASKNTTSKLQPIGIVAIPADTEPVVKSAKYLGWSEWLCHNFCDSLVCLEHWLSHFLSPLLLTVALTLFIWWFKEDHDGIMNMSMEVHSLLPIGVPTHLLATTMVLIAFGLWYGTFHRSGTAIVLSIVLSILSILLILLISLLCCINSGATSIDQYLKELLLLYDHVGQEHSTVFFDSIQKQLKCCGINKPQDWFEVTSINVLKNTTHLPVSCCCRPDFGSIKCPYISCTYTEDASILDYYLIKRRGCSKQIENYIRRYINLVQVPYATALIALILTIILASFYLIRLYASLATQVHPHIHTLVEEITGQIDDDIFGNDSNKGLLFDDQVRKYILHNLSRCMTMEQVHNFLVTSTGVCNYIRSLPPDVLARDILCCHPALLDRFENKIAAVRPQPGTEEGSQLDSGKKYERLVRARKDIHFLLKRAEHYKSFINRMQNYDDKRSQ